MNKVENEHVKPGIIEGLLLVPLGVLILILFNAFRIIIESLSVISMIDMNAIGDKKVLVAPVFFQGIACTIIFFIGIITMINYIKKKRRAPKIYIGLLITYLLVGIIYMYMLANLPEARLDLQYILSGIKEQLIFAIVIIPYFTFSERVKETFIN